MKQFIYENEFATVKLVCQECNDLAQKEAPMRGAALRINKGCEGGESFFTFAGTAEVAPDRCCDSCDANGHAQGVYREMIETQARYDAVHPDKVWPEEDDGAGCTDTM